MRECSEYEITLEKCLNFIHHWTERIKIKAIIGDTWMENRQMKGIKRIYDFYLSEDAFKDKERLLKYYKDVPVWNLHLEVSKRVERGYANIEYALVANCYFRDIRDAYLLEKQERRKQKK